MTRGEERKKGECSEGGGWGGELLGGRRGKREDVLNKLNMLGNVDPAGSVIKAQVDVLRVRIPEEDARHGVRLELVGGVGTELVGGCHTLAECRGEVRRVCGREA